MNDRNSGEQAIKLKNAVLKFISRFGALISGGGGGGGFLYL